MMDLNGTPRPPRSAIQKKPPEPQKHVNSLGLSPMLTSLLSVTIKDGLVNKTAFSLLRDVYPYAPPQDQKKIATLLEYRNAAGELIKKSSAPPIGPLPISRPLTQKEKFFKLMQVLRKYGGKDSSDTFTMLERMIEMKSRFDKMGQRAPGGSMPEMIRLLSDTGAFGKGGGPNMGNLAGMMNMVNMMSMMNNMSGGDGGGPDLSMLMNMMKNK